MKIVIIVGIALLCIVYFSCRRMRKECDAVPKKFSVSQIVTHRVSKAQGIVLGIRGFSREHRIWKYRVRFGTPVVVENMYEFELEGVAVDD